jgi:bifunctional UDP-N-acetylglucosamine pyrophosphorylase/glucosamine-1-phosphate N-acetyltransferase
MLTTSVIILAAGKGTRMKSQLPKVLQPLANKPLLGHVLDTVQQLELTRSIVIYGHGGDLVKAQFSDRAIDWVEQSEQLGTGHAVQMALPLLPDQGHALILSGDVPLVSKDTLRRLLEASQHSGFAMISLQVPDATGYGRIVRQEGQIVAIVEHKDANAEQRQIKEINTGLYCVSNAKLQQWLPRLSNANAQGEYYLTDIVAMAVAEGIDIAAIQPEYAFEVEGINDRLQLATLERQWQYFQAQTLMRQGVHLIDPQRFDLRGTLQCGHDVQIDINVIIEGDCELGDQVRIGAGCILKNTRIAAGTVVQPYSVFDGATVGANNHIGPFARLRPQAVLADDVHIGNFVEVKNTHVGYASKANHFTYLGDAEVGSQTNIGAGTITCNYDGVHKHKTIIGDQAFIGSNSSLVAPLKIGDGATVGAGSVISRDVAPHSLAVERAELRLKANYQRPQKRLDNNQ